MTLEIKNLNVEVKDSGKTILKGINLKLEPGKVNVLMGPNGSGKSSLAQVLMGDKKYKITSGKIIFEGHDITNLSPDKRAKKGIFSFKRCFLPSYFFISSSYIFGWIFFRLFKGISSFPFNKSGTEWYK